MRVVGVTRQVRVLVPCGIVGVVAIGDLHVADAGLGEPPRYQALPADHPFWSMSNVIITAHQGGFCDVYVDHALPTIEANLERFLKGDYNGMINAVAH